MCRHGGETAENLKPNLVDHVDHLIGGSSLQQWRDYLARAEYFDDREVIEELKEAISRRNRR